MVVDILILGAGWSSSFLIALCKERNISYAATTRDGRDGTIPFTFDPNSDDVQPFKALPSARTVVITFPLENKGTSRRLLELYASSRAGGAENKTSFRFIHLGTSSIWDGHRPDQHVPNQPTQHQWYDRRSTFKVTPRAEAEEELLSLSSQYPSTVLNLAGLWGGSRSMRAVVGRLAPTKEALKNRASLHMIHGIDVARSILAVHQDFDKAQGERWLLTDGRVYDWWDLASAWGSKYPTKGESVTHYDPEDRGPQAEWVRELMDEANVRALPRDVSALGRALDSRDFWRTFALSPLKARLEEN
ncbi:hypothetical protein CVT24_008516 [Panaeolus cyanescens]|uniref:NAD-dependent epimerase/dehydratase domain-containing protein n=1 Tax=Panaeolus cyanescens TaxID=181874 RepID=A0A409VKV6_9AGAR|nr:hypothetical protein CVT24_008516 [Panaeolus cyanescens]